MGQDQLPGEYIHYLNPIKHEGKNIYVIHQKHRFEGMS